MSVRPILGVICCNREVAGAPAQAVMTRYIEAAMSFADAACLLVPSLPGHIHPEDVAARLDGLLLTGSPSNVEPARYGDPISDAPGPFDPARDEMSFKLIAEMVRLKRPIFGICRGFQEVNVAFGGSLRRDASANPDLIAHHAPEGVSLDAMFAHEHDVTLTPGGVLARELGIERMRVNSAHFQGVRALAPALRVEAQAEDGVIEAVSAIIEGAPVLAVQWHPEWRTRENPYSIRLFDLMGRILRGEALQK